MGKVEAGFQFSIKVLRRNVEQSKSIRLAFSQIHCAPDVTHFPPSRHERRRNYPTIELRSMLNRDLTTFFSLVRFFVFGIERIA